MNSIVKFDNYQTYLNENKNEEFEAYILYFDFLGYKSLYETPNFFLKVRYLIEKIILEKLNTYKNSFNFKIIYRVFSDNVIIAIERFESGKKNNMNLRLLCHFATRVQSMALFHFGFLIRGAITKGNIFINENFVYGTGLIKAYELESKQAKHPRIIIDKDLNDERYISSSKHCIVQYESDYYSLNYLHYYFPESMDLGREIQIANIKKFINDGIRNNVERIKEKYEWVDKYNIFLLDKMGTKEYYI